MLLVQPGLQKHFVMKDISLCSVLQLLWFTVPVPVLVLVLVLVLMLESGASCELAVTKTHARTATDATTTCSSAQRMLARGVLYG